MRTLEELARGRTLLDDEEIEYLHRLLEDWQLISDLSFADLLLWCPLSDRDGFICVAQMRPYTAQTLHPDDIFGTTIRPEETPIIDRAFLEGTIWRRDEPILVDGVQVRMEAIPVPFRRRPIAVMTIEGAPLQRRRPGQLEENYLKCAEAISRMVMQGHFPFKSDNPDAEDSPRVGDGVLRLRANGTVAYASPNAVSALRRLGMVSQIEGERIDGLGIDVEPAMLALDMGVAAAADVEEGGTVVLQRAIPFLEGAEAKVAGALVLLRDVTELRHRERMLQRKEAVIREIHHRVKNNLQTIASLLRIQARRLSSDEARAELQEAVRRIASIALVHETLSQDSSEAVELGLVTSRIIDMVAESLTLPERNIEFRYEGDPGRIPPELATSVAVVLVELLQNAVEHAFIDSGGTVTVRMGRRESRLWVEVVDTGVGLPEGFGPEDEGLGLQIVRALIETELSGDFELTNQDGAVVRFDLPVRRRAELRP